MKGEPRPFPTWLKWVCVLLLPLFPVLLMGGIVFCGLWACYSLIALAIETVFNLKPCPWNMPSGYDPRRNPNMPDGPTPDFRVISPAAIGERTPATTPCHGPHVFKMPRPMPPPPPPPWRETGSQSGAPEGHGQDARATEGGAP